MKLRDEFIAPAPLIGHICFRCNLAKKPTDAGVLDMERHIEFEGWVFLCQNCVIEAASLFGLMSTRQGESLKDQNRRLADRVSDLEMRCNVAEEALDALRRYETLASVDT